MGIIKFPLVNPRNSGAYTELQIAKTTQQIEELTHLMQVAEDNTMELLQEYYRLATELFLLVERADQAHDQIAPYPIIQLELF